MYSGNGKVFKKGNQECTLGGLAASTAGIPTQLMLASRSKCRHPKLGMTATALNRSLRSGKTPSSQTLSTPTAPLALPELSGPQ